MHTTHNFSIAEFNVRIIFKESRYNSMRLLPSFEPFRVEQFADDDLFFQLTVDDELPAIKGEGRERIGKFDTGNGDTIVDSLPNGGYQYIIKDINGADCCLLQSNKDFSDCRVALNGNYNMRCFGLNNALMLIFAFAGSLRQTLLIHASLVRQNGYGYAFIAKSGTGKSTQVSMWLRHIPGCDLMNDDNPIVRIIGDDVFIYGSPWSGKTPCYRNIKARLGAVTRIDRAPENSVDKLPPIEAFASFLPSCSSMKWDKDIFNAICNNVTKVVERIGIYTLHCLPNEEAARICHSAITVKDREMPQKEPKIAEMQFANAILLPEIIKMLNEGHTVTLRLKGFSMRPFLEDGRDKALLTKPTNPKVGDPVLAEIEPKHFVLHRIIDINDDNVTLRGDGNIGTETCKLKDIQGAVIGFYRKNRETLDRTDGRKWLVYSWLWTRLYPLRRYLLAFYRRIWMPLFGPV